MVVISLMPAGVLDEDPNNDLWRALYSLTPDGTISVLKKQGLLRVLRPKENNQIMKKALCIKLIASYQRKRYKRS